MAQKKGLGRSFDSLLPTELLNETFDPTASEDHKVSELRYIDINDISPDQNQPRKSFDEAALNELAASIKEHGVVQPLVVVPHGGQFQIVAGERRYRASKKAGLEKLPAIVRTLSAQHRLEISLIENLQRRDLNSLETATAYLKLRDQFNMKLEEIGARVGGKSIATISNALRLLQLPENAKNALVNGEISEGHARQILALDNKPAQDDLLKHVINEGWSVRRAEQFVIGYKRGEGGDKKSAAVRSTFTETPLTKDLSKRLSTEVKVKTTAKGGQLVINFKDEKDLDRITKNFN
ncbi:MAG: ParB/RepB/Spo0J family partition protein [Candidatus Saccharibacteria bacterium]|nr:ParB/RepB/Spo0J family partition protein [Candidatus Saccharibacteria bacterium]